MHLWKYHKFYNCVLARDGKSNELKSLTQQYKGDAVINEGDVVSSDFLS